MRGHQGPLWMRTDSTDTRAGGPCAGTATTRPRCRHRRLDPSRESGPSPRRTVPIGSRTCPLSTEVWVGEDEAPTLGDTVATHASASKNADIHRPPHHQVVVGVDSRGRSVSALVWAVEEAQRDGTALTLVSARSDPRAAQDAMGEHDVATLARRLTVTDVETREIVGDPVDVLLRAAGEADLIVVGCRLMRPAQKAVVGSTSQSVARWSPVPVVVVPEQWMQPSMASAPVVAGIRPKGSGTEQEPDREVLEFAFGRASVLKVPLVVVSAWEIPSVYAWSPTDIERLRSQHQDALHQRLAPWRESHPEVDVDVYSVAEEADQALLDASPVSQLVVVGRHHSAARSGRLGSTVRGVLRHARRPVAIVPAGTRDELLGDLDIRRTLVERSWGPMF